MAKLGCKCGHTIVDQVNYLPYKGDIIPDTEFDGLLEKLGAVITSLTDANMDGTREEWIKANFLEGYPTDLKDYQMIHDLFLKHYMNVAKTVYQCENCGGIWIQQRGSERFESFSPDSDKWKNILA